MQSPKERWNEEELDKQLELAAQYIREADYVLVAAGAGMSFDSGIDDILPEGFARVFPSMAARGYKTMLQAIGVDFEGDPLLAWGYYAQRMKWYRETPPHEGYHKLFNICKAKEDYFVFTSNVDGMFERSGFDENKFYLRQGTYKYLQCYKPCSDNIWLSEEALKEAEAAVDPDTLLLPDISKVPKCPKCGGVAYHNANAGDNWVSGPYKKQGKKFLEWVQWTLAQPGEKRLVAIELGCGERLPFIRHPLEQTLAAHPRATLVRLNPSEPAIPEFLRDRAVGIPLGAKEAMERLTEKLEKKKEETTN
ncbi:NAD-dependent deacetylase [Balamuthia mandrillaris]